MLFYYIIRLQMVVYKIIMDVNTSILFKYFTGLLI